MAWIESHQSLSRHRKTLKTAGRLSVDRHKLIGHLHELWWWALDNVGVDGKLTDMTPYEIALAAQWDGDHNEFVDALVEGGFLEFKNDGYCLHDWNGGRKRSPERHQTRKEWESMAYRVRPLVFKKDGYKCVYCGSTENLEVDHIVPICRGGTNDMENLQTLCRSCNRAKGCV